MNHGVFYAALAAALFSLFFARRLSFGSPTPPMAVTFGPRILLLGGACIATALVGLSLPSVPYEVFGIVDGALKVAVGAWLLSTKPAVGGGLH